MHPDDRAPGAPAAPRYNMYGFIHKAMRALMAQTLIRIGRMEPGDPIDREAALGQLRGLIALCRGHLDHENRFVHPAMEARAPGSSHRVADEHMDHVAELDALDALADALATAPTDASCRALVSRLYRQLAVFIGSNFEHMEHEEDAHNAVLWTHYTDDELLAIEARLHATLSPAEQAQGLRLMLGALDHHERLQLLRGIRATAPTAVYEDALVLARSLLDVRDREKLDAALEPEAAAA